MKLLTLLMLLLVLIIFLVKITPTEASYVTNNTYKLDAGIVFVLPALAIFMNIVSKYIFSYHNPVVHFLKNHHFPIKWFEDVSIGGYVLVFVYYGLLFAVGVTTYYSNRNNNNTMTTALIKAFGQVNLMNYWLVILPTSKTSILGLLTGIPFERALKYHKALGYMCVLSVGFHFGFSVYLYPYDFYTNRNLTKYSFTAFCLTLTMVFFAFEPIRRQSYELFQTAHHLYVLVVIFVIIHYRASLPGFLGGMSLHAIDYLIQYGYFYSFAPNTISVEAKNDVVTLVVPGDIIMKKFYQLGSYCFIHIPSISKREWHPFTISEYNAITNTLRFNIKALDEGTYTRNLYHFIETNTKTDITIANAATTNATTTNTANKSVSLSFKIAIYGPFGNLAVDLSQYSHICLIAGGIGVTPMLPILDDIVQNVNASSTEYNNGGNNRNSKYSNLKKVRMIWSIRDIRMSDVFKNRFQFVRDIESNETMKDINKGMSTDETMKEVTSSNHVEMNISIYHTGDENKNGNGNGNNNSDEYSKVPIVMNSLLSCGQNIHGELDIKKERPDIPSLMKEMQQDSLSSIVDNKLVDYSGRPGRMCVIICGPTSLTQVAVYTAIKLHIDHHSEVFNF